MNSVLESLANASFWGGLFILAVGALCLLARRLPAWVRAWLWGIAGAQMLVRLVLAVPVPVGSIPFTEEPRKAGKYYVISATPRPLESPAECRMHSFEDGLVALWLGGVLVGVAVAGRRLAGARRLVRHATPVGEADLLNALADLMPSRPPRLLESPFVKCPLLVGWWRPAIVVPLAYSKDHGPSEIRMALAHEVAHLRRRDPWMALLSAATQTVFFFHPIVWWAGREASLAREEACDLEVLRLCEESPNAYAHFLLKSAQARTPVAGLGAAYGYRNLRRRITMLKGLTDASLLTPRRAWTALIVAGLVAALPWTVVGQSAPAASPVIQKPLKKSAKDAPIPKKTSVKKVTAKSEPLVAPPTATPAAVLRGAPTPAPAAPPAWKFPSLERAPSVTPAEFLPQVAEAARADNRLGEAIATAPARTEILNVKFGPQGDNLPLQRTVTAHFVNADIKESLLKIFTESGSNFVFKAKIQPGTLTGKFTDMPAMAVLEAIFEGIDQRLTLRFERDVVYVVESASLGGAIGGVGGGGAIGGGGTGGGATGPSAPGGLGGGAVGSGTPAGPGGLGGGSVPEPANRGSGF